MSNFIYNLNGDVLVFGDNYYGQLGLCHNNDVNSPTLLINDKTIENIICGTYHSVIYINSISSVTLGKDSGDVLVFGWNVYGQLGLGHNDNINVPTLLINDKSVKNIICGGYYTILYKDNGDVLVFGDNNCGQLGLGHTKHVNTPTLLMNDTTIKNIICGRFHTVIYKDNGDVLVFGDNNCGQLGLGHTKHVNTPTLLMNDTTIKNIICGRFHTVIYINSITLGKDNGDILVFGHNGDGQLGLGHYENMNTPTLLMNDTSIRNITCGGRHTIIYKDNGDVLVFGDNRYGQLGLGHNDNINVPTLLMNDKTIKNIICGNVHTIIYKDNGNILVFGDNEYGQLGLGHNTNINIPILLMNNPYVKSINGNEIKRWSIQNYRDLSILEQERIKILYYCLKYIQIQTSLKIPKFVVYEILKFI